MKTNIFAVSDIMKNYNPVYPNEGTWEDTINLLLNDLAEKLIVDELIVEYKRTGMFREPIVLGTSNRKLVQNGTHRVAATFLIGKDTPILSVYDPDEGTADYKELYGSNPNQRFYEIHFTTNLLEDEKDDDLYANFRSFKVNDDIWLSADAGGNTANNGIYLIYLYEAQENENITSEITQAIQNLLNNNIELEKKILDFKVLEVTDTYNDEN